MIAVGARVEILPDAVDYTEAAGETGTVLAVDLPFPGVATVGDLPGLGTFAGEGTQFVRLADLRVVE